MPPASPAATRVLRIASRREVLPWSTWPMKVTTGARGRSEVSTVSSTFFGLSFFGVGGAGGWAARSRFSVWKE